MQRKMQLKIHIYVAILIEVFTQIRASANIRTCQTRSNTRRYSKYAQEVLNVEASSQNSVTIEDNLTIREIYIGKVK